MNQVSLDHNRDSGEIDLIDLIKQLWKQKWLIASCTIFATILAAIYAFFGAPTYQATAGVMPPRLSDISGYNLGRSEAKLEEYKVEDVYDVFKSNLLSVALQRQLFESAYLPSLKPERTKEAKDQLWKRFNEDFSVQAPDKDKPEYFVVKTQGHEPKHVAEWANMYIKMAAAKSAEDMQKNIKTEIGTQIQSLSRQVDALRITAKKQREDRIARLQEALQIAKAVGFNSPQVTPVKTPSDGDFSDFIDGSLMYMRGAKAVEAELSILEKRKDDDPFITNLRDIENQLDFLQKIDVNPDNVSVYTLDSSALVPETPIKPKKQIIFALGFTAGLLLGIFAAIIRRILIKDLG